MMARVALLDPDQATGRVREVFEKVKSYYGLVPGFQRALAYLPEITDAFWTLSLATLREGRIPGELKRVFFAVTAYEGGCEYCTAANMIALLGKQWSSEECVEVLQGKPSPRLSDKENAAVNFARLVGRGPAAVTDEMVEELRAVGWTDAEIVEIVASVALMRYCGTVNSALGMPLEKVMEGVGVSRGIPLDRRDD